MEIQCTSTNSGHTDEKIKFSKEEEVEEDEILPCFMKQKKGRPMADTNLIYDETNGKFYDPNEDPVEYKKARK
jgi:hypothetical protein